MNMNIHNFKLYMYTYLADFLCHVGKDSHMVYPCMCTLLGVI
jgi:hypothetical protein